MIANLQGQNAAWKNINFINFTSHSQQLKKSIICFLLNFLYEAPFETFLFN